MSTLVAIVFWLAAIAVIFPYIGYPITLAVLKRTGKAYRHAETLEGEAPKITLIVSAYNEADVIQANLDNALALKYPADKLQIIVISDASDDGTDDIVTKYAGRDARVILHRQEERLGKTAGINSGIELATGDLVVFSDANAMYEDDALQRLAAPFSDGDVGYVVGAADYVDSDEGEAQASEGLYWRYELALKEMESSLGSVVGGDGAIYAIRRDLYWPLQEDDINDFVNPLQIIAARYRGVFNKNAKAFEGGANSFDKEFRRKRRIVNRSFRAFLRYGGNISWADNALFLFQLYSHKVLRWFALPFIALAGITNLYLVIYVGGAMFTLCFLGLALSILLAFRGRQLNRQQRPQSRLVYLFYYFYLVNVAALLGLVDELRGVRHTKWDHVRGAGS